MLQVKYYISVVDLELGLHKHISIFFGGTMQRVTGIGGIFFKASNAPALHAAPHGYQVQTLLAMSLRQRRPRSAA